MASAEVVQTGGATPVTGRTFLRLVRNALTLFCGSALQTVAGLMTLAVTARTLGPERFGVLVLANTYATIVVQLVGFQSWQPLIRYGSALLHAQDERGLGSLVKLGAWVDASASVVAAAVTVLGVLVFAQLRSLDDETVWIACVFGIANVFSVTGAPTAVLRLFDKYQVFVRHSAWSGLAKLAIIVPVAIAGADTLAFGIAWAVTQVVTNILLCYLALQCWRAQGYAPIASYTASQALRQHEGIVGFFFSSNLSGTMRVLRELDVPIVGLALGSAAAGGFRLARQIANCLNKAIDPFFNAIYPDLSHMHAQGLMAEATGLVRKSALYLGAAAVVALGLFLLIGQPAIVLALGESFSGIFATAAWCVLGSVFWAFAQPLSPMLIVLGRHRAVLAVNAAATAVYLGAVIAGCYSLGMVGAGLSYAGYLLLWTLAMGTLLAAAIRSDGQIKAPSECM